MMSQHSKSILDPNFIYTPSTRTDVAAKFKTLGWVPPRQKYNPDCAKLEQLARDIAYTKKYQDLPSTLQIAALAALEPSSDLNKFSHNV